jgi:hypothetical protein
MGKNKKNKKKSEAKRNISSAEEKAITTTMAQSSAAAVQASAISGSPTPLSAGTSMSSSSSSSSSSSMQPASLISGHPPPSSVLHQQLVSPQQHPQQQLTSPQPTAGHQQHLMLPQQQMQNIQVAFNFDQGFVPKQQHDSLVTERNFLAAELQKRQQELNANTQQLNQLFTANMLKDKEIAELKRINQDLMDTIAFLENKISGLEVHIAQLESKNGMLEKRVEALEIVETDNKDLRKQVAVLMLEREYGQYLVMLQDLNRQDRLETNLPLLRPVLQSMRGVRVDACHFILDADTNEVVEYKRFVTLRKLKEMSPACKKRFEKHSKGLVDGVINHLLHSSIPPGLSEVEKSEIDDWFEE